MKKPVIFLIAAMLVITLMPMAAFGENIDQEPYRCSRENCALENCRYGEACPYAIDGQGCNSACYVNSGEGAYCYRDGDTYCRRDGRVYDRAEDGTYRTDANTYRRANSDTYLTDDNTNRRMDDNTYRRGYRNNGGGHCRSFQYSNSTF